MSTCVFTAARTHPQIQMKGSVSGSSAIPDKSRDHRSQQGLPKIEKWSTVRLKVTACMLKLRQQRGAEYITAKTHKRPCAGGTIRYANEALTYGES